MSERAADMPNFRDLELFYGHLHVGSVRRAFMNDDTWYGQLDPHLNGAADSTMAQIRDYIHFREDWNERLRQNLPANADEFGKYDSIIQSGLWSARDGERVLKISEAPVFFKGGDVSWRTA